MAKKTKKPKDMRISKLGKIMRMEAPVWLTPQIYADYQSKRSILKDELQIRPSILSIFDDISKDDMTYNQTWKSYTFFHSPKVLVEFYNAEKLISDPTTGQDPKDYSKQNLKCAAYHAGRHWGYTPHIVDGVFMPSKGEWIESGTFNLVKYPNGKVVLEPCNVEHRLWGLIGFPLDLVPLMADAPMYYYNDNLPELYDEQTNTMIRRMKVNGMYLSEIVMKANLLNCHITQEDVLKSHFYSNKFEFTILPFYSKSECEHYFKEVNTNSSKSQAQLFHADSNPIMSWIKEMTSPKYVRFSPAECKYHPFFELFGDSRLLKLEGLMLAFAVVDLVDEMYKPMPISDKYLVNIFNKKEGYQKLYNQNEKLNEIVSNFNFLYSVESKIVGFSTISKQKSMVLLMIKKYLEDNNLIIADMFTFSSEFNHFWETHQVLPAGGVTKFGQHARNSSAIKDCYVYTMDNFLVKTDNSYKKIGIVPKSTKLGRVFSKDVIVKSLQLNNGNDIDNKILISSPVGGHIISDMELCRMTEDERDTAFKLQGISDKFDFDKNCRAMSSYHNLRMGVLTLSEYLSVIELDDFSLNKVKQNKYNELKKKPILV
jgi:hypothetical protein